MSGFLTLQGKELIRRLGGVGVGGGVGQLFGFFHDTPFFL